MSVQILDSVVQGDSLPILISGAFLYPFTIDHVVLIVKVQGAADPSTIWSVAGGKLVVTTTLSAGGQVVVTGAGSGQYQVSLTLTPAQTTLLTNARYVWEVIAVDAAGDVRHLVTLGALLPEAPASQASS